MVPFIAKAKDTAGFRCPPENGTVNNKPAKRAVDTVRLSTDEQIPYENTKVPKNSQANIFDLCQLVMGFFIGK